MSPNGRYVLFCAPGAFVTDEFGTHPSTRLMLRETDSDRTTELMPDESSHVKEIIELSISDSGLILLVAGGDAWIDFRLWLGRVP